MDIKIKSSKYLELFLIVIFVVLGILQGYKLIGSDLSTYIPFTLHEYDSKLLTNDLLIETVDAHPVYIWKIMGYLLNWIDLILIFKGLFIIQIIVIVISVVYFFKHFFGNNYGWVILLLTLTVAHTSAAMGRYGLNPYGYFHPGALAVGATLFAYTLLDQKRWTIGGVLTGLIFLFHPFTAVFASLLFFLKLIIDFRQLSKKQILYGSAVLILVASPSWFPHFLHMLNATQNQFNFDLWHKITLVRMQHSFYLSQWVSDRFIHLLLALFALWFFRKHPSFRKTLPIIITTVFALLLMGIAELFYIKLLLQLQLARCSYFLFILLSFYVADRISSEQSIRKKLSMFTWLFVGYVLIVSPFFDEHSGTIKWYLLSIIIVSLLIMFWYRTKYWKAFYVAVGFLLVFIMTGTIIYNSLTSTGRIYDQTNTTNWEDMQNFCREYVPEDKIIMTPIYLEGFRCLSRRAIYGTYKDGAPHNYSDKTFFQWWQRMQNLGVVLPSKPPMNRGKLPIVYHDNAVTVAKNEGIEYVVYDKQIVNVEGKAIYENERFGLLILNKDSQHRFIFQ